MDLVVAQAHASDLEGEDRVADDVAARVVFSVAVVADVVEARLDAFVELSLERVNSRVGRCGAMDQSSHAENVVIRRASRALVRDALARLRATDPPPYRLSKDVVSAAAMWAEGGHGLGAATTLCCVAHDTLAQHFEEELEIAVDDLALRWECARVARTRMAESRICTLDLLSRWHESSRRKRPGERSRSAVVQHLLATDDGGGEELGYDLERQHVGLVASISGPVEALARRTGLDLLLVSGGEGVVWGWLSGQPRVIDHHLEGLGASPRNLPGKVAVGEPGSGIAGFRRSHSQAVETWRVLGTMPSGPRVLRFAEAAPVIALMRDRDLARCFISHEIGRLPGSLQETAKAYMEAGQNAVAAAARTRRSRSTIERQLRRIEEILGQPFRDRGASLMIAMQACAIARAEGWWGDP